MNDVIPVYGGDHLQFDGYSVEVFRSLHSRQEDYTSFAPGHRDSAPTRPRTLGDLVEGRTLAFQVAVEGGPTVLLTGTSNFAERELTGARPDVAVIGMSGHAAVHGYPDRLLSVLGAPPLLVPGHHDDMVTPLGDSGVFRTASPEAVSALGRAAARQAAPGGCRVLTPATSRYWTSPAKRTHERRQPPRRHGSSRTSLFGRPNGNVIPPTISQFSPTLD